LLANSKSEEDQALKINIDGWVEEILEGKAEAFGKLDQTVRTSTGTMTSIPKPFKFLITHYKNLENFFNTNEFTFKVSTFSLISGEKRHNSGD